MTGPHPYSLNTYSLNTYSLIRALRMTAADYFKISSGYLVDPLNGLSGQTGDLWIRAGKFVSAPSPETRPARQLDAAGLVVMPGGIDMHSHIAGPKVNTARKIRPEEKRRQTPVWRRPGLRSGTMGSVPSTFATGYKYAGLGYTTAFDAAVPPLAARHAHEEFQDTPCVDRGFYVLMGNNHYALRAIQQREPERLRDFVGWLLTATRGYAPKLVNPGGVEVWKHRARGDVDGVDDPVDHYGVTPRQIIGWMAAAAEELRLPHPLHIHCNQLGLPGNWATTLESMRALEGRRGHLTHIQFHSYGGGGGEEDSLHSRVPELAEYVNSHPNVTVDVGQVLFGKTTSMTGDGPLGYFLHQIYGGKWFSADTELECGCGIAPIEYRRRSLVHSLQWAIGLEWYLLVENPWQIAMSTDHPNGGSFLAYPQIIHLLMDRNYRREMLDRVHPAVRRLTRLAELDREYSLEEIAIITRAAPARMLGLQHKGHLGVGGDADLTLYEPHEDRQRMFQLPKYVIKGGELIVADCELRRPVEGTTLFVAPAFDVAIERDLREWFEQYYSVSFRNYPVTDDYLPRRRQILP